MLKKEGKGAVFMERTIYAGDIMESTLAPLIDKVMRSNPTVYIKSHPKGEEGKPHIELHLSTTTTDAKTGERLLRATATHLSDLIRRAEGKATTTEQ
jgi:molybdopterin-biosynthesis enzyme MoeA-like protein